MDSVLQAITLVDELNPEEWRQWDYDRLQKQLAQLGGLHHLIDAAIAQADSIILRHEASEEHQNYERTKMMKTMLTERSRRVQREASYCQTLCKNP
jgi:hypothetical protein